MITATGLTKQFKDKLAVNGVDLKIHSGECFGLLGPNGAGKSTIISMIYGATLRTSGDLKIFGIDPAKDARAIKRQIGVVTQDNALDEALSVEENLRVYAAFQEIPREQRAARIDGLLKYLELDDYRKSKIQFLSGGFKRRLVFVRAMLRDPKLLILDEPTTGLDPGVRQLLWQKVRDLKAKGMTILLTTHYMHEAEALSDRVAIMNHGKIITIDTPAELILKHGAKNLEDVFLKLTGESLREKDD